MDNRIKFKQISENSFSLEYVSECPSCNATGLYQGMGEWDGAAVVCYHCKGTGKVVINKEINLFVERKNKKGITRVYSTGGGYVITDSDAVTKEGKTFHFSQYGIDYESWKKGGEPKPLEELICPMIETRQMIREKEHPAYELYLSRCNNNIQFGSVITKCSFYKEKHICWMKYWEILNKK
jgi:hypothetical protein